MSEENTYSSWWILTQGKLRTLCQTLDEIVRFQERIAQQKYVDADILIREVNTALYDYGFFHQLFTLEVGIVVYNELNRRNLDRALELDSKVFAKVVKGFTSYDLNEYFKGFAQEHRFDGLSKERASLLKPLQDKSLVAYSHASVASIKASTERQIENSLKKVQQRNDLLKQAQEKVDVLTEKLERVADIVGVANQAEFFESSYKEYKWASRWSLLFTIVTAILLCTFAYFSISANFEFLKTDNVYDAIQLGLAKVLIFSTLVYLLTQFVKDYNNNRHNAVLNKHRDSALRSYRSLIEATEDEAARDLILKEAASCIFSIQPTGYSAPSSDAASGAKINLDIVAKPIIDNAAKALNGKS